MLATQTIPVLECRTSSKAVDTAVVPVFQDTGKKPLSPGGSYHPLVLKLRKKDCFSGATRSLEFVRFGGKSRAENVLLVGVGSAAKSSEENFRLAGASTMARLDREKAKTASVVLDGLSSKSKGGKALRISIEDAVRAFAEGMVMSTYKHKNNLSKPRKFNGPSRVTFVCKDQKLARAMNSELQRVRAVGEAVSVTREWSNLPSNIGTPAFFAKEAKDIAKKYGLKCTVIGEREARKQGMGLFLGVAQGSDRECKMAVLEYVPKEKPKNMKTIALVGKGVTFDSGGISIKPSPRMEDMKHDMTGAATVIGAAVLAAKWKVPNRVITIVALTENMPGGDAIQPGNVLTSRSGKTVEVLNTDAEGRLVLADALDLAHDYKPDVIIDAATLTGAVTVALGKYCCAVLGNDQDLIESLESAGKRHHERMWQLPLYQEYSDDMKSDYADLKNISNTRQAGTILGAAFLKSFIKGRTKWAHLDIAATAWDIGYVPYYPKRGASGAYVRTLARFAADYQ